MLAKLAECRTVLVDLLGSALLRINFPLRTSFVFINRVLIDLKYPGFQNNIILTSTLIVGSAAFGNLLYSIV